MKTNELPRYKNRSTGEIVHAGKIAFMAKDDMSKKLMVHTNPDNLAQIIEVPLSYLYSCQPVIGGYLVADVADNLAWLNPSEFHIIYSSIDDEPEIDLEAADFSDALMWLKEGRKVARSGWNGKGQFVLKAGGYTVDEARPGSDYARAGIVGSFVIAPHLDLRNAQGVMQPGWVPSQGDLFATDWIVVQ